MPDVLTYGTIALIIQLAHSIEELLTGFNRKWFITNLSFPNMLICEIVHLISWILVTQIVQKPSRIDILFIFLSLMLLNGSQRIAWAITAKRYVPGLFTAPFHLVNFALFYVALSGLNLAR